MRGLVGTCGGGKEHALGIIVAVEAMEKRKEDRVGRVCGEVLEMHAGELVCGEEGKLAGMLETAGVWRDDAIRREGSHGRAEGNYERRDKERYK